MKLIAAALLLSLSSAVFAVDITITLTAPQATRAAAACGKVLSLAQPCTMAEAKTFLINLLRQVVLDAERQEAQAAIIITPFDPQ